jgi:DeoR/GlpR family transcriptional regulator of sugar metabolism
MGKRAELILEFLDGLNGASYKELADHLQVSTMTVRRACNSLYRDGKVIKIVGGVRRVNGAMGFEEKTADERLALNTMEKRRIAKKALELIQPPCTIFMDGSTTCLALAKLIDTERKDVTIVTHSVHICLALRSGPNNVVCAGGELERRSLCFVGAYTESFVGSVFVDTAFVSATGFVPSEGTFESAPAAFRIKQIVAKRANEVVLLADHTKFGRRGLSKVLDISEISLVITDAGIAERNVQVQNTGTRVWIASD